MKAFLIFCFFSFSFFSFAQDKPSKNEKASFEVLGNCGMCKDRIEKARWRNLFGCIFDNPNNMWQLMDASSIIT